ncbi:hypothetical protein AYO20_11587 [Fonsecaea nubica]|uniref:Poly(A) polymerase nucleotidyltransferase domain-containing protein n=1 Tax=Fonsecaea nubica TaxID=856822 RepID=A0A178BSU4_9EURO|nr:hypothetical protein AYO20_11587 [Fonsecaea nubica]OAL19733.1 hypothetical protein AYO20_11587 [Fonsecaea nubica]
MFHWRLKGSIQAYKAPIPLAAIAEYSTCTPGRMFGVQRGRNECRLAHAMTDPEPRNRKHGITGPMSMALPEPLDNEKTAEELKRENNYERQIETEKRMYVLKLLSMVWIVVVRLLYCFDLEDVPVSFNLEFPNQRFLINYHLRAIHDFTPRLLTRTINASRES